VHLANIAGGSLEEIITDVNRRKHLNNIVNAATDVSSPIWLFAQASGGFGRAETKYQLD
jgi:hypothetical protein